MIFGRERYLPEQRRKHFRCPKGMVSQPWDAICKGQAASPFSLWWVIHFITQESSSDVGAYVSWACWRPRETCIANLYFTMIFLWLQIAGLETTDHKPLCLRWDQCVTFSTLYLTGHFLLVKHGAQNAPFQWHLSRNSGNYQKYTFWMCVWKTTNPTCTKNKQKNPDIFWCTSTSKKAPILFTAYLLWYNLHCNI